jgi:uncharacterized repeat protein (TIGR01451 family)
VLSHRRRRFQLLAVLTAVVLAVAASSATAVHDLGIFELDENAVSGAAPGDDWETLAGGGGSSLVDTFVTDPVETPADDILDGGQTKDINNLDEWLWKGAEPNDKNDIEHAFAASYEHSGELIIYFGLDRMDNSGDAAAGFWFLKRPVEQKRIDSDGDGDMENVFVFEGTNTLATHSVGDTLVQTDFTNGGSVERIEAYQWGVAPTGTPVQPGSPLRQIATGADCDLAPVNDTLCGQVNRNSETVPANWPQLSVGATTARYFFKGSGGVAASSTFPTATFFEGGINATKVLGSDFCAAQMLAETRQSQSETSTLEDKAEAGFKLCSIDVEKSGPEKSKVGDDATYTIKITNTGAVTLFKQEVDDSLLGDLTGNAACGASLAPGASCTITVDYTVQAGDPDPLINTVDVVYNRNNTLTGDQVTDSSSHSTNLFQPSIEVTKTGDDLSKVGDVANYTIKVCNTSSADSPALVKDSVTDDKVAGVNPAFAASLAPGACESHNFTRSVAPGDANPLVNTATAHYHPDGFPNDITDSDSHSTNLFQPSLTITKTGDTLSKVGDVANYTIEVCNTGSADSPNLVKDSVTDNKIANVGAAFGASLAPGACESHNFTRTVQPADPDPLINTATAHYHPAGFPNDISGSDSHSTNLFQPRIVLSKTADHAFSKAGDTVTYTILIQNISSSDSPNLLLDSFSDARAPSATPPGSCSTLAAGASCSFSYAYTVQTGDPDPLVNFATAHYHPTGFPNDITGSTSATVDLLHPAFTVEKACTNAPVDQGGTASFKITYKNTGDADLVFTPAQPDEGGTVTVGAGQTGTVTVTRPVPTGATSVDNTVSGKVTLATKYGLSNQYDYSASGTCSVKGKAKVGKTVSGQPPATGQSFTFELRQGASTVSQGTVLESKNTDASGNICFSTQLIPGQTYQICEWVFPGWNTNLAGDGPLFVPESIIPPALPNPNVNNLTVCANFTVTSGQTRTFNVENSPPPGGRALTIGFWKNGASCANSNGKGQKPMLDLALAFASQQTTNPPGGLVVFSQNPGSAWPNYAAAFYLVLKGNPLSTDKNILAAPDCAKAVNLLNKSTTDGRKKMSSDPLFNMTAQLIAAQLNRFTGAGISGMTITNIDKAVLLNGKYVFNGLTYSPQLTAADATKANCLGTQLDNYNNGRPVSACP